MKKFLALISAMALLAAGSALAQSKIYKTKDKDGNVVYTDQPPPDGAEPMVLPELSIVKQRENQQPVRPLDVSGGNRSQQVTPALPSQAELAQTYAGAEISSPDADETVWGTGNSVNVVVDLKGPLLPGMLVQLVYDGQRLPAQAGTSVTLNEVDRGQHSVAAEVVDPTGAVVARTEAVNFYMRQNSVNFNNNSASSGGN